MLIALQLLIQAQQGAPTAHDTLTKEIVETLLPVVVQHSVAAPQSHPVRDWQRRVAKMLIRAPLNAEQVARLGETCAQSNQRMCVL